MRARKTTDEERAAAARLDWNGQIKGQLELPHDIVQQFRLPGRQRGRTWEPEFGHTVTLLPTYGADGRGAPKYRPVRYDDWIKEQTRPWRREPDRDVAWLLAKYKGSGKFEHEVIPDEAHSLLIGA
jgi:hypothetical protein